MLIVAIAWQKVSHVSGRATSRELGEKGAYSFAVVVVVVFCFRSIHVFVD